MSGATEVTAFQVLAAAPDAILLVDAAGTIQMVNSQTEHLFGYHRDEMLGASVEMLVPGAAREAHPVHRREYLREPRRRAMGHGVPLAARRRDGTEFPAEISLSAIETPTGTLVAAAVRDVTDRLLAVEAQALLAAIVESSHDAIVSRTLDGVITSWNSAAERIYGYPAHEIVGKHIFAIVPEDQQDDERELLGRIARGEHVDRMRMRRRDAAGNLITVSVSISPIYRGGRIVGAASVSRDLTRQEQAEAKFQGLLEAAPDAIVGVSVDGVILLVNAQAQALFGYGRDELVGQPVEVLVPEALRASHPRLRRQYFADPRPRPMGHNTLLRARRRDGTEFPAEISLSALDWEDGLLVSASIRDVTERIEATAERERLKQQAERERLEAQLQQSQRLESLGQLAGGVAHDFNNLLGVILNYSDFVTEELSRAIADGGQDRWAAVHRDVAQIQQAAHRAADLTHQLLTFGRREVVRPQVMSVNACVSGVEELLRRTLGEHVQLTVSLAPDLQSVRADPGQLAQVLINLAVNARHAMPGGGRLVIETQCVQSDEAYRAQRPAVEPGGYAQVRVADTGHGMPLEVAAHAFDPFFTTKPKGEGTGLGLATVYGIVSQAGGHVWLQSEPDRGTTVTVLLPVTDEEISAEWPPRAPAQAGDGELVLVVEDETALGEVTRRILGRNGYQVMIADNGPDALALLRDSPRRVDLLITDVIMPGMLGKEVAEQARVHQPGIPVLYMSGYAEPVLNEQGTLEPGVRLISKPFAEPDLLAAVAAALDEARAAG
ncbi:histidine kinase [Pilimelia terevasa]|uniref:histidine kinase n=1 Tax=Pilimelia terevasa TaxID=53372 RepID=A0A8J3FH04_9ACTN|nr:PAS domain S-box protein [Pilimelia terevasa]GGK26865.1 histidine kinase [Pilimelia terevasa]